MVELKVPATEPTDAAIELAGASLPNLTSLSDDTAAAWASMGSRWGLKLQGISPCAEALTQGHQCFRTLEANVATLKELDRPGLAQLEQNGVNRWVELTAWRGDVVVMALGKSSWQVPATDFAKLWTGRFTTLWRQPLDQTSRIYAAKPDDAAGQWLNTELQKLQAKGELPTSADSYQKRVIAFQKTHGLSESDGVALPSTFIKLNPLVGVVEPKLSR